MRRATYSATACGCNHSMSTIGHCPVCYLLSMEEDILLKESTNNSPTVKHFEGKVCRVYKTLTAISRCMYTPAFWFTIQMAVLNHTDEMYRYANCLLTLLINSHLICVFINQHLQYIPAEVLKKGSWTCVYSEINHITLMPLITFPAVPWPRHFTCPIQISIIGF